MLSKKVLKDIQSLGLKKFREETGLFIAEGPKIVEELAQLVPEGIEAIYATSEFKPKSAIERLQLVEAADLTRISQLKTPNQVVAVLRQFESKTPVVDNWILYLDTIQDPGNFGTIIRIADWFGVQHVVCSQGCADLYNPKVVQSTMASIARVNVYYDKDESWLKEQQTSIYAASLHGKPLQNFAKNRSGILLIGNESKGIRKEFLELSTEHITISRRGEAESLNAAVATGILLSHLVP